MQTEGNFIYREETPTGEEKGESLFDHEQGEIIWRAKEEERTMQFEEKFDCYQRDVERQIIETNDRMVDMIEIKSKSWAERLRGHIDNRVVELRDESTAVKNQVSALKDSFDILKLQNEQLIKAIGDLYAVVNKSTTESNRRNNGTPTRGVAANVRTSRGSYGGIEDDDDSGSDSGDLLGRRGSLYETMGTPGPRDRTSGRLLTEVQPERAPIIHLFKEADKEDSFKLKSLSIDAAVKLIDHIQAQYREGGIVKPLLSYVSLEVQEDLIANGGYSEREARKLRYGGLAKFTDKEVLGLIQQTICNMYIHRPSDFVRHLRNARFPSLPEDYKIGTSNFRIMATAIGRYVLQFATRYDFLQAKCDVSCIPPLFKSRNINDSVVSVFLENIPFGLGRRINGCIPADQLDNCKSLSKYMSLFKDQVASMERDSRASLNLYEILKEGKTEEKPATQRVIAQTQHTKKLHFVGTADDDDISCSEAEDTLHALGPPQMKSGPNLQFRSRLKDGERKASPEAERTPGGCLNYVMGECSLGNDCRYAHAPEERLKRTWQWYIGKLGRSKFAASQRETLELLYPKPAQAIETSHNAHIETSIVKDFGRDLAGASAHDLLIEDTDLSQDLLAVLAPKVGAEVANRVHKEGEFRLPDGQIIVLGKTLFDSGALHSSYVSSELVERNRSKLKDNLVHNPGLVRLGDNKTVVRVKENLVAPISFRHKEKLYTAEVSFIVWSMPGLDAIIGLPDIVGSFCDLFVGMIRDSKGDLSLSKLEPSLNSSEAIELINPWTTAPDEEAPEEVETDLPCSFSGPLLYLSITREEAISEYNELLNTHVSNEFKESTDIINLLKSDLALDVFVPQTWKGIEGVPDLELEFKDTLPESMRPRARPVNPRLYDNAHKEFQRLCTYFYVPADSAIASPLVIAPKATKPFIRFCGDYVEVNKHIVIPHYPIPKVVHALEKAAGYKVFLDIDMTNSFHQIRLGAKTSNILSVQTPWGLVRPVYMPEGIGPASGILQRTVMDIFNDFQDFMINIFDNILVLCHDYHDATIKLQKVLLRAKERGVVFKFSKTWLGFGTVTFFGYEV